MYFTINHFSELPSTNIHALEAFNANKAKEGDVFWTDFQSQGKGQMGGEWLADSAKNLLFSLVVEPGLDIEKQYFISMIAANAVYRALDNLTVEKLAIKWPNDILINEKKVAGILIQNAISGNLIKASVVGIGLNVNQAFFEQFFRSATSLSLELGRVLDRESLLQQILSEINLEYQKLKSQQWELIKSEYLNRLFAYKEDYIFSDANGEFKAYLQGIQDDGKLLLSIEGHEKAYELKEVKFIKKA